MRALVVYESMFGNTRSVAEAVAAGLRDEIEVETASVGDVALRIDPDLDLLVVGGPTHAFGMSRPASRRQAGERARAAELPDPQIDVGLREWLAATPPTPGLRAAAFDTEVRTRFSGSASRPVLKALRRLGCDTAPGSRSFYVEDYLGPMLPGELERARAWGQDLAQNERRVAV